MRIRATKPEFWRSERISSVSWDARLVLKGLESYVDDNGAGKDDLALIVADVFPRDLSRNPTGTLQKVSEAMTELTEAGLLWRYEDDGTNLLYIAFWESVQRIEKPSKGRFRRPDGTLDYRESQIRASFPEPSRNPPGTLRSGTGEQGNRGTGEEDPCAPADADDAKESDRFDEFWDAYDKKQGRKKAEQKYRIALRKPGVTPDVLIEAAAAYIARQRAKGSHPQFTKDATTWLNGEHWEDEAESYDEPSPLPYVHDIQQPPDGLTAEEYRDWCYAQAGVSR
jgi:hypothetical protein